MATFSFPHPSQEHGVRVSSAAEELDRLRTNWLNPAGASEADLKKRTLTNLYNERPAWLANAHDALDAAVAGCYGWPADISDNEVLKRLLEMNIQREPA